MVAQFESSSKLAQLSFRVLKTGLLEEEEVGGVVDEDGSGKVGVDEAK